jgi:hypothetical protein
VPDRPEDQREDLIRGEGRGRQAEEADEPAPGFGVELGPDDVRDLGDEDADGQREHDR